jgi:hypothetical protein
MGATIRRFLLIVKMRSAPGLKCRKSGSALENGLFFAGFDLAERGASPDQRAARRARWLKTPPFPGEIS